MIEVTRTGSEDLNFDYCGGGEGGEGHKYPKGWSTPSMIHVLLTFVIGEYW